MREYERIRAAILRGGTSKGVYLLASELPGDPAVRDRVILSIFGSPDRQQINGLGGADPLTSKVAIIARSERDDADVDYTFGYVGIETAIVDYEGNCGNISQGRRAVRRGRGAVRVVEPLTKVRIFNTNTKKVIEASVQVKNGKALTGGEFDGPHVRQRAEVSMRTLRLTMAQALVRYLAAQRIDTEPGEAALFAGVFTIFGHGNVAGLGEALAAAQEVLPTFRGHNEQSMAHIATAYAKAMNRRQVMACTTSIGPGATNLVTAAATAHVNRLPLLLLPGDVFASRRPDPVLQQLEDFGSGAVSVNDCLRPVSRFWDRLWRPEHLLDALPKAVRVLTDPALCGPVTLALPQDTQTEAYDYPAAFFAPQLHRIRRPPADPREVSEAVATLLRAQRPLIVCGGGVHYSLATEALAAFASRHGIPVAETQAGKGALVWAHPLNVGGIGVTGTAAANALAREADVVLAVGTRLADFTTGSRALFADPTVALVGLNVAAFDAGKHAARPLVTDARTGLAALAEGLGAWRAAASWTERAHREKQAWNATVDEITRDHGGSLPSDAEVLGAVNRHSRPGDVVVCAAGGLPGELHKLWRVPGTGGYHLEYGYSCMGYEVPGGIGVKMARPERDVFVLVGDGSYLMLNSELASAVAGGIKIVVVLLDNHGFGCISRLQAATGGAPFKNLLADRSGRPPRIDFAAHARALGAEAELVKGIPALEEALPRARQAAGPYVLVIETDPSCGTAEGGAWWDVAVPEVSERAEVRAARATYEAQRATQRITGA